MMHFVVAARLHLRIVVELAVAPRHYVLKNSDAATVRDEPALLPRESLTCLMFK